MLREQDYPLPTAIDAAYDDADILIMELDMDDLDGSAAQQLFNQNGVLQDGTTLRDLMGEESYQRAVEMRPKPTIFRSTCWSSSEPWLAAMTVEMMTLYRIGFNPTLGVEMIMSSRATDDGKPIEGLETIEEQLAFLDGLSLAAQRDMLLQTLRGQRQHG